jgi:hypothetical protein
MMNSEWHAGNHLKKEKLSRCINELYVHERFQIGILSARNCIDQSGIDESQFYSR